MPNVIVNNIRVGDTEREAAARRLRLAVGQGYLSLAQYEQRVGAVFAAETRDELHRQIGDLPIERLERYDPARRARRRAAARRGVAWHLAAYLAMVSICLTVWLAVGLTVGAWYFWPIWPALGGAIGVISHATPVRLCVR